MSRPSRKHEPLAATFDNVLLRVADENKPAMRATVARPFLKWVGGKRSILPELMVRLPEKYADYYEPFIGGGALFFNVQPKIAYLSDINFHLVLAYRAIRDDVDKLIPALRVHAKKHSKDYYLKARQRLNKESDATKVGALLIYLNKTCYNGLYRVNKAGEFNVPIGDYDDPAIVDEDNLRLVAKALRGVEIEQRPFWQTKIEDGAFYYLDPPYHKVFDSYDASRFGDDMHEKLAEFCRAIHAAGGLFMVSNSATSFVRKLYEGFKIEQVMASRMVSCKGHQRGKENELLIRNYG